MTPRGAADPEQGNGRSPEMGYGDVQEITMLLLVLAGALPLLLTVGLDRLCGGRADARGRRGGVPSDGSCRR